MSFSDEYDDYNQESLPMNDLIEACDRGDWATVNLLLASGEADVSIRNENGYTPFLMAVADGHLGIVREFLFRVPKVAGDKIPGNATALMIAANYGQKEVAEILLECPEINIYDIDRDGCNALRTAIRAKNYDIADLISKYIRPRQYYRTIEIDDYSDYDG